MTPSPAFDQTDPAERSPEFDAALYERIQPGYYDHVYRRGKGVQWFWHIERYAQVAANLPFGAQTILDLGCGPGTFLGNYCQRYRTALGVDLAAPQIQYATATYGNAHTAFEAAEAVNYVGKMQFDIVVSIEVIEHVPVNETQAFLQTAYHLLVPGGTLILATPNYASLWPLVEHCVSKAGPVNYLPQHINHFDCYRIRRELTNAGFQVKNLQTAFVLSPFLAFVSTRLARAIYAAERRMFPRFGSEIIVAARRPADLSGNKSGDSHSVNPG